ncbi:MAG: hypothetical protein ACU843_11330 [Gammaproteobacteria bacterium]
MRTCLYLIAALALSGLASACVPYHHYPANPGYQYGANNYYSYRPAAVPYGYNGYNSNRYNRCERYY